MYFIWRACSDWTARYDLAGFDFMSLSNRMIPRGTNLEKGDMDVRWTRPPFSRSSAAPQDSLFSIFQFHNTPLLTKNHKIFEFFANKKLNLAIFYVHKPENLLKSNSESLICAKISSESEQFVKKISSTSPQICRWSALQAPLIGASRRTPPTKPKLSIPREWSLFVVAGVAATIIGHRYEIKLCRRQIMCQIHDVFMSITCFKESDFG